MFVLAMLRCKVNYSTLEFSLLVFFLAFIALCVFWAVLQYILCIFCLKFLIFHVCKTALLFSYVNHFLRLGVLVTKEKILTIASDLYQSTRN